MSVPPLLDFRRLPQHFIDPNSEVDPSELIPQQKSDPHDIWPILVVGGVAGTLLLEPEPQQVTPAVVTPM
jgi:hypothetical protein